MSNRTLMTTFLKTMIVAEFAGGLGSLLISGDYEVLGAGLIVPLGLIPSVVCYLFSYKIMKSIGWATAGFAVPFLIEVIWLMVITFSEGEGSGMAFWMAKVLTISAVVTLLTLHKTLSGNIQA